MFKWLKKAWDWATLTEISQKLDQYEAQLKIQELKQSKPKRPKLYKQATVVTTGELPKEKKVPLKKGTSNATRQKNIATEIKAGKKPAQAVAIGYAVQREAKKTASKATKKAK